VPYGIAQIHNIYIAKKIVTFYTYFPHSSGLLLHFCDDFGVEELGDDMRNLVCGLLDHPSGAGP
jgi:hypothetical protein